MKTFLKSILFAGALGLSANGLIVAQTSSSWQDQWYRAKFGRTSPAEEARLRAANANTAFREECCDAATVATNNWMDRWYKAKFGRTSPAEEARQRAEKESTAFREEREEVRKVKPATVDWVDQFYRGKYGRPAPGR